MLKVAILSFWHVHAWDYTKQVLGREDCKVAAVWDEIPERGRKEAEVLGVPFYENLDELLANPEIDAVVVDTPSNMHGEVMVKAAKAKKHIFTEKVLAISTEEADEIIEAVKENGVTFMISLPRLTEGRVQYAKKAIEDGLLGKVTLVRTRLAHNGAIHNWLPQHFYNKEQCGGGALIDLGCHPMYLAAHFLGMPRTVTAHYGYVTGREVEDNAVAVLGYDNGAIAVVEAGFAAQHSPYTIEIHGTEGTLLFGDHQCKLRSDKLQAPEGGDGWIYPDHMPEQLPSALDQWVDQILKGTNPYITIEQGRQLTVLMEASNQSAEEGKTVIL